MPKTGSHEAQHLIPQEVYNNSLFLQEIGFQVDHHQNGIMDKNMYVSNNSLNNLLDKTEGLNQNDIDKYVSDNTHHHGYHKLYSNAVSKQVDRIEEEMILYEGELAEKLFGKNHVPNDEELKTLYKLTKKEGRKRISDLEKDLRTINKEGITMYKKQIDLVSGKQWGELNQADYNQYFESKLQEAKESREDKYNRCKGKARGLA